MSTMPSKRTYFNKLWLTEDKFKAFRPWLQEVKTDKTCFRCAVCGEKAKLSNIGIEAVRSHAKNKKHQKLLVSLIKKLSSTTMMITNSFTDAYQNVTDTPEISSFTYSNIQDNQTQHDSTLGSRNSALFACKDDDVRAEIMWLLKVVELNLPFSSLEDISACFSRMFPDSIIARNFFLDETKGCYTIVHGLAPYFLQEVKDAAKRDQFALSFSEALNNIKQRVDVKYQEHDLLMIANRIIKDGIKSAGGFKKVTITKEMIQFVISSRRYYHQYLQRIKGEAEKQRKSKIKEVIYELREKIERNTEIRKFRICCIM